MGLPWALSFAPVGWWWCGLALLLALPHILSRLPSRQAAWFGFLFGLSAYGAGVSWLYISLHVYGGLPSFVAFVSLVGFSAFLALYPALAAYIYRRFVSGGGKSHASNVINVICWASIWTFTEWCRGWIFSGFSWLSLGDALVDSPFNGLLPWLGNHGALWLLMVTFGLIFSLTTGLRGVLHGARYALISVFVVVFMLLNPPQTIEAGKTSVVGIQPNVDQSIKFDPDQIIGNMKALFALGEAGLTQLPPDGALIFPETVNPLLWSDSPPSWLRQFRDMAAGRAGTVITGGALKDGSNYYNSIVQFQGDEAEEVLTLPPIRHEKRHLVPFGETIPTGFHWFVRMMNMPMGEFTPGSGELTLFDLNGVQVAGTICYEDTFSDEFVALLHEAPHEPAAFLNVSNLAWFQDSWALDQHAQMGRARSSEHRKPTIRVTNTGLSGLIDQEGRFIKKIPILQETAWAGEITGRNGITPFAKYGVLIWYCLWSATLVLLLVRYRGLKAYNSASTN